MDLLLTQKVMEVIRPLGAFESKEEMELKQEVLRKLNQLVKDFVKRVSVEKVWIYDLKQSPCCEREL